MPTGTVKGDDSIVHLESYKQNPKPVARKKRRSEVQLNGDSPKRFKNSTTRSPKGDTFVMTQRMKL
jgi:hypothetical protein